MAKVRLKINPKDMPKPQIGTPKPKRTSEMSKEAAVQVTDYFRDQHHRRGAAWIKSNTKLHRAKMH